MTPREEILQQALALSPEDRAVIAAALEDSLAESARSDSASTDFLRELQQRSAAFQAGQTTARPGADVIADLKARQREASA